MLLSPMYTPPSVHWSGAWPPRRRPFGGDGGGGDDGHCCCCWWWWCWADGDRGDGVAAGDLAIWHYSRGPTCVRVARASETCTPQRRSSQYSGARVHCVRRSPSLPRCACAGARAYVRAERVLDVASRHVRLPCVSPVIIIIKSRHRTTVPPSPRLTPASRRFVACIQSARRLPPVNAPV